MSLSIKNEFKSILKEIKIGKPFASKIINEIIKQDREDIWKKSIELIGFELDSYLEDLTKTSKIPNMNTLVVRSLIESTDEFPAVAKSA